MLQLHGSMVCTRPLTPSTPVLQGTQPAEHESTAHTTIRSVGDLHSHLCQPGLLVHMQLANAA